MVAPKFTVVVPTYQRVSLLLSRSLPSVKRQAFRNWECLVVSDGPDYLTHVAVKEIASQDHRFHYLELPRHAGGWGAPCRSFGAGQARCELIAYLDDDNAWLPNHLAAVEMAFVDPQVDFAFTQMQVAATGQVIGTEPKVGYIDSSIMAHRSGVLEKYGNWPQVGATYTQDGETAELWTRHGARWKCVPQVTVDYYTDARR